MSTGSSSTSERNILFVDDEQPLLDGVKRQLRGVFTIQTVCGAQAGLALITSRSVSYSVIVSDMRMPGIDGVSFLKLAHEQQRDAVRLMLTGQSDIQTAVRAVNEGNIFRFLTKPCEKEELVRALSDAVRQYELVIAEKELLQKTLRGAIQVLTEILGAIDPEGFELSIKTRQLVSSVGTTIGDDQLLDLELAAMLSEIGTLLLPPLLVKKARTGQVLSKDEARAFERVGEMGAALLKHIPRLERVAGIIQHQSLRFDGRGPGQDGRQRDGLTLSGDAIPRGARILRIVKDFVLARSEGESSRQIFEQMIRKVGAYDPELVAAISQGLVEPGLGAESSEFRLIKVKDLELGANLIDDVVTVDGMLLIRGGNCVTPAVLARLKNYAQLVGIREPLKVGPAK